MHAFIDYILFLSKFMTAIILVLIGLAGFLAIAAAAKKKNSPEHGTLKVKNLNNHFEDMIDYINSELLDKKDLKTLAKQNKKSEKDKINKPTLYVLDFIGDIHASKTKDLARCIDAILLAEKSSSTNNKVLLRLDSPGGVVNGYGLAAAQLARFHAANIELNIAIDKMAASGGYMMAAVARKIIAAPFAIIGSIGVVMQMPNFNRLLKKNNIDFEQLTAGEYKRTLTLLGENTDKDRAKAQEDIDDTQVLFKNHITQYRPNIEIDKVATGEHWFGSQCIEKKLIDEIKTSNDYILEHLNQYKIFSFAIAHKQKLSQKLSKSMSVLARSSGNLIWKILQQEAKK
jgi:serine protease SohB